MYLKKGICLFLLATAVLTLPVSLNQHQQKNLDKVWADGGAPPVGPPKKLLGTGLQRNADTGARITIADNLAEV